MTTAPQKNDKVKGFIYMAGLLEKQRLNGNEQAFYDQLMDLVRSACRPNETGPGMAFETTEGQYTNPREGARRLEIMVEQIADRNCRFVLALLDFAGPTAGMALMHAARMERPVLRIMSVKARGLDAIFGLSPRAKTVIFDPEQTGWEEKLVRDIQSATEELGKHFRG